MAFIQYEGILIFLPSYKIVKILINSDSSCAIFQITSYVGFCGHLECIVIFMQWNMLANNGEENVKVYKCTLTVQPYRGYSVLNTLVSLIALAITNLVSFY